MSQVEADHWYLKANFTLYDNHYYCMPEGGAGYPHRPVRFLEHVSDKGNRPKQWDFDLKSYTRGDPDPDKFSPPVACSSKCSGCR
jgi:hypothetical protein